MDDLREKVINALECRLDINHEKYKHCLSCQYRDDIDHLQWACMTDGILEDALSLLKAQDTAMLQGFLDDIPSSESILNSVNCHAISLEDASRIIAICAYACDVMSPSGFIHWLKERFNQDFVLKGCIEK